MRNCIIAVFCSYVNRLRQYCCIIRKNGARPWLLVGKGRRRDAGNGKQRSRLHSRLSQSLRRSYNRLGDPTIASAIPQTPRRSTVAEAIVGKTRILLAPGKPSRRKHAPIGITMRQNCGLSKEPFYPQSCTKRFRPPFAKGGGSEEQSPRRQRRRTKERAQRSAGRGGIPALEGIRRFMRLAFCPLVVRQSAALPCGKAAASLFRAAAREPGGTMAAHRSSRLEIGTFIAITQKGGQRPPFLSEQNVTWPFQPLRSPR